jgi:holo-[acyl-carrier protein] synthase
MAIVGTGVDMIEIERLKRALEHPLIGARLRARLFTTRETEYCESRGITRYQSYAARFAAKEAAMKALGTGWGKSAGWRDFEVVRERGQAPCIALSGKAALLAGRRNARILHLSLTHTRSHAIAHVIAES